MVLLEQLVTSGLFPFSTYLISIKWPNTYVMFGYYDAVFLLLRHHSGLKFWTQPCPPLIKIFSFTVGKSVAFKGMCLQKIGDSLTNAVSFFDYWYSNSCASRPDTPVLGVSELYGWAYNRYQLMFVLQFIICNCCKSKILNPYTKTYLFVICYVCESKIFILLCTCDSWICLVKYVTLTLW